MQSAVMCACYYVLGIYYVADHSNTQSTSADHWTPRQADGEDNGEWLGLPLEMHGRQAAA